MTDKKIEKIKSDKITMNEQNWNLKQDADQYIPQKLPFYQTAQGLIKPVITNEHVVADLFVGERANEHEAMLVQLPGTLPFAGLEPHDGKGLQNLLEQAQGTSIGKLRVHRSGRVSLRLTVGDKWVDFDLNKGI